MMRRVLLALLTLPAVAAAQSYQMAGSLLRISSATYSRGTFGTGAGELLQRFDADDLTGYGIEIGTPGMQVVRGVVLGGRDFGGGSNLVDVTLYTEDPARPGHPDLGAPLGGTTGVQLPGQVLSFAFVYFPAPVRAPLGRDLFVGVRIPPSSGTFAGAWLMVLTGTVDVAGPGLPTSPPEANSYRLYRNVTTNGLAYGSRGQFLIDLLTTSPSGMAATISNQASYPVAGLPPGVTTLLSGLHPDAASPPRNAGRADDLAFLFTDVDLVPGSLVAFLASFQGFGIVQPLASLVPGSVGGVCLDQPSAFVTGLGWLDQQRSAAYVTTVAPGARLVLRGASWAQQAIAFDSQNGVLRGSQCARQHF